MTLKSIYSHEMRHQLGVFPVWQPGDPIDVGDIGTLDDGMFHKQTSLKSIFPDLPVKVDTRQLNRPYRFSSKDCIVGEVRASGSVPAQGAASLEVKFGSNGGVIFDASDIHRTLIDDLYQLREYIRTQRARWPHKCALVTAVDKAGSFRLLISETRNGSAMLSGNADALANLKIADASVTVSTSSSAGYQVKGGKGAVAADLSGFGWLGYLTGKLKLLEAEPPTESEHEFVELNARDFPEGS